MEINKTQLANRFLTLRKKLDLTQQEASKLFDVTLRAWQTWEYGLVTPFSRHIKLLEQFEKNPPQLIGLSDMCRVIRNRLRLRKYQMAELFNVAPNTWSYWEKGEMKPSNEFIQKIKQTYKEVTEQESLQKAS